MTGGETGGQPGSVEFLTLADLVRLVNKLGAGPVRDIGLLGAACARPQVAVFGVGAYPGLCDKAAALLHSIVRNHALVDGNKRLGWLAVVVFLDIDGVTVDLDDDGAFGLVMEVAEGVPDVDGIAAALAGCARPSST